MKVTKKKKNSLRAYLCHQMRNKRKSTPLKISIFCSEFQMVRVRLDVQVCSRMCHIHSGSCSCQDMNVKLQFGFPKAASTFPSALL